LILNAIFLAHKINAEKTAFTLVDVLSMRYGKTVEVLISLITITSFIMLLAGNLVGMGFVCAYCWGTTQEAGIWIAAAIIWAYTVGGGYVRKRSVVEANIRCLIVFSSRLTVSIPSPIRILFKVQLDGLGVLLPLIGSLLMHRMKHRHPV
jgi:Na+/pantothenate symporter